MQPFRLDHPAIRTAGDPVRFNFDGRPIEALEGETIGAALAAAGIAAFRTTRTGAPRGLWCGMGACFDCIVTIDGVASQRACLAKVAPGQEVRSCMPAGTPEDPLRALCAQPGVKPETTGCEVLVIGAGLAGLAAAIAARRAFAAADAGAGATVIVLDERPQSGGQYFKPLAPSHRAETPLDRQFAEGLALVDDAREVGVIVHQNALAWSASRGRDSAAHEVGALIDGRAVVFSCRQLVIAPGAYERATPFPGWTLPGVMTTGAAQTLARAYRVAAGSRVVIAGNGPLNLQLATELLASGVNVVAVLESAAKPSIRQTGAIVAAARAAAGLLWQGWQYLRLLARHRVPVYWGHAVIRARPDDASRVCRVIASPIDAQGNACGPAIEFEADTLCVGYGFVPSTELARMLGCEHRQAPDRTSFLATVTAPDGASSVPGIYVVGDGADIGGARVALARGSLAGAAAARAIAAGGSCTAIATPATTALNRALAFQRALWTLYAAPPSPLTKVDDDTLLCRCEEIRFGSVREQIRAGRDSLAALKRNLRLGMGRCQGRYCANTAAQLIAEMTGRAPDAEQRFAPREPAKPVPAGALAFEKPEWGGHRPAITPNLARPASIARTGSTQASVVVIGAGVVGSCLAWYLSQSGEDVLVVERDDVNLQASGANAGSLHVQLLSFDFGARAQAGGGPAAATLPLGPMSVRLWQSIAEESGEDLEISIKGGLMVADSDAGMRFIERKVALERSHGVDAQVIDANELQRIAPKLSPELRGAEWCPLEGKINPLRATYVVAGQAARRGARFLRGCNVTAIERKAGNDAGFIVRTDTGSIRTARVVNASGAWSSTIGDMLGVRIPVVGAPLQMIVTEPAPPLVDHLVAHADRHLSMKQAASGGLIIGGGWTAAFDPAMRMNRAERSSIEGNLWVARRVLPALDGLHVLRCWAGMNVNIDGAPILGEVPGVPGFFNAVTSNGYTLAPIVARLVSDLIVRGRTDIDVTPYLIDRFQ